MAIDVLKLLCFNICNLLLPHKPKTPLVYLDNERWRTRDATAPFPKDQANFRTNNGNGKPPTDPSCDMIMASHDRRMPTVWLIGGGTESLVAASCLIHDAHVQGGQIHVLEGESQIKPFDGFSYGHSSRHSAPSASNIWDCSFYKSLVTDGNYAPANCHSKKMKPPSSIRHDTEIFMSQSQNFASQEHAWLKNRRDILHFLLQEEENFSNTSIQDVFERSIFETRFWKLFSSRYVPHWATVQGRNWHALGLVTRY